MTNANARNTVHGLKIRAYKMLTITIRVDAAEDQAQAVKESLAMYLEKFGDTRVISITAKEPEQLKIE